MHIAKVIVHDVDGIVRRRTDWALINSVVETAGFQFGEDFREETRLGVDPQHAGAESIQQQQTAKNKLALVNVIALVPLLSHRSQNLSFDSSTRNGFNG